MDGLQKDEHRNYLLFHRPSGAADDQFNFRTFRANEPFRLSNVLPVLEDMGVHVYGEQPYKVRLSTGDRWWIQDFELRYPGTADLDIDAAAERFQDCFNQVISGNVENDGFNRLVLAADLDWREVSLVRCYGKYLQQLKIPYSQDYLEDVLVTHSGVARSLVEQFKKQFDPAVSAKKRASGAKAARSKIKAGLDLARTLDEDRILRGFAAAVNATLRTNYFQTDASGASKSYISVKFDPSKVAEMPLPRPKFEVFVYAIDVEGVHLRGGEIARGGIRWSDRREDFRTEVLGLMKAQVVKNTVIVPTGGERRICPETPAGGGRDIVMQAGIACYRNLSPDCSISPTTWWTAKSLLRPMWCGADSDDPYLVVAADKGTATFSDIANALSADYGFWLDDAFASGGSAGYDHKKMGITARGAWEAVRRHFRNRASTCKRICSPLPASAICRETCSARHAALEKDPSGRRL